MNTSLRDQTVSPLLWAVCILMFAIPVHAQSTSLSLSQAIEKSLSQSPKLAAAKAALGATQGAALQADALPNPEVGFEAENLAGSGTYRGTDSAELTYSLSQKVELGKRPARRHMANANIETATAHLQSEELDIIRDTTIAYAEVLAAEKALELTKTQEKLAADVLTNVSKRVGAARDPLIYKSQAEVSHATAKLAQAQAQRNLTQARKKLSLLWGGEALTQSLDITALTSQTAPQSLEVYQTQLAANPNLTRFTSMKLAQQEAINLEKAQAIPDPSLNLGLRTFRESNERAMVVGISMPIPVFDRNQGNVAKARAEFNQIESQGTLAQLEAEQALLEAWQEWDLAAREATQLSSSVIPAAEKAYSLAREGYDRGRFAYLEILTAQRTLSEAQGQYTHALLRQVTARAQVERLTASHTATSTK